MRKTLLTFCIAVSAAASAQQIGNGSLEDWQNVGSSTEEPTNWNSFKTGDGGVAFLFGSTTIQRSTSVRPGASGTYCARIWTKEPIQGTLANGNMTLGRIHMGSSTAQSSDNYNYSDILNTSFSEGLTAAPDSLVFWCKYTNGNPNSLARVSAVLHGSYNYRDGYVVDAASTPYKVAEISYNYPSTNGQWVRKSIPWNYTGPASVHSYILITFATNSIPGGGNNNDEVLIDDVELIYNGNIDAVEDNITTLESTPVDISVLGNDSDPENNINIPSINITAQPTNGAVSVNTTTGVITYTPNTGYTGTDMFTYEICDNGVVVTCDVADVTVTINPSGGGNNPIVANNDSETTTMNTPVDTDVTSNDVDLEGQIDLSTLSIITQPTNGIASANTTTGIITYTPDAGYLGADSYVYEICDGGSPSTCDQATVNINVTQSGSGSINENAITFSCVVMNGVLTVQSSQPTDASVVITDLSGKLIAKGSVQDSFDLNDRNGILLVSIQGESSVQLIRIMK